MNVTGGARNAPSAPSRAAVDEVLRPSGQRDLRRLPRLFNEAMKLLWAASPRHLLVAGALQVIAGLSLAAQLLVLRRVLDQVVAAQRLDVGSLTPELLLLGSLLALAAIAALAQAEQRAILAEHVTKYTTGRLMEVSSSVELIQYEDPVFYDRLQRARVNASLRPTQIASGVLGLMGSGVAVVAVGVTLLLLEPVAAGLIILGGVPTIYTNRLAARALHAYAVRQTPGDRRRAYLYDALTRRDEAQEVRAFDSSDHLRQEHDRLYDEKLIDLRRTLRRRFMYGAVNAAATAIVTVAALAMLLWFVEIGRLDIGAAGAAVGAVILVASRVRSLAGSSGTLYEGALFLGDFTDFIDEHEGVVRSSAPSRRLAPFEHGLSLEDVSFTYPSRETPSLEGITLTLRPGEVVALVGENGSGKTTLTKLLGGLYRPTSGAIRWDGQDLAEIDLPSIRDNVTVIFQDFARYFLEVHENIAISRIGHVDDEERVQHAARLAGADRFIERLAHGYRSLLGPAFVGGSDISTGQWQRIALARAYFRDAPVLILDEPTAALDPRGEYEIFQQVRRLAEGHTLVLVSHRFSSVRAADRIIVLEGGRIVEEGSHDALMARQGLYAELFTIQAEGYQGEAYSTIGGAG